MKALDIIVPLFDEEKVVLLFYKELIKHLPDMMDPQILFIDDGSRDKTLQRVKEIASDDPRISYISLSTNCGQQAAIYTGVKYSRGDAAIVMDCDLQDPPALIPQMIEAWRKGADIVIPRRRSRKDRWSKLMTASIFYFFLNLSRVSKADKNVGEFYLLSRAAIDRLLSEIRPPLFLRGQVQNMPLAKEFISYDRAGRAAGRSGFTWKKMLRLAYDACKSRSLPESKLNEIEIMESNLFVGKSVAIIGGGMTGLASAFYLSRLGFKTFLYEAESQLGGLASSVVICGDNLERSYHHIFKNDADFIQLVDELGLSDSMLWRRSRVAMLDGRKLFPFNGLVDYLKLPAMTLPDKLKMAIGTMWLTKSRRHLFKATAREVIEKSMGKSAWARFWKPFFEAKFGLFTGRISAAWFQARLQARAGSRSGGKEVLGYPEGGFGKIIQGLKGEIESYGGRIKLSSRVTAVRVNSLKAGLKGQGDQDLAFRDQAKACAQVQRPSFSLETSSLKAGLRDKSSGFSLEIHDKSCATKSGAQASACEFDYCISTLAPSVTSTIFPGYKIQRVEYIGFVGVVATLAKPLSDYYWINVLDPEAPFGVLVEQGNLTGGYKKHHLYLGKYCARNSDLFQLHDSEIAKIAEEYLLQIKPELKKDIVGFLVFREPYAQPIIDTEYERPAYTCATPGFYTSSMAHISPEDRGLNQAVKESKKIVQIILNDELIHL